MATILVADDDPDIRALLEYRLSASGHDPLLVPDGQAAADTLRERDVDLVVVDWMMPRMAGVELCRFIRDDPDLAQVPVLMLTAKSQEEDVQRGLSTGADDYVLKPFNPREVMARIAALLSRAAR